jgi:hypothetical protein
VFFGPTSGVLPYFEKTFRRRLPLGTSVPDFVLDLVNVSFLDDVDIRREGGREGGEEGKAAGGKGEFACSLSLRMRERETSRGTCFERDSVDCCKYCAKNKVPSAIATASVPLPRSFYRSISHLWI